MMLSRRWYPLAIVIAACCFVTSSANSVPPDLSQWNVIPGFHNKTRVWNRTVLDLSIVHPGHAFHVQNLLSKLEAGKPIVVMAIGSSFVHLGAGCWQPSMEALWDLGIIPNPGLYPPPHLQHKVTGHRHDFARDHCLSSGGFMEGFVDTLNRTWPHPRHVFVNNGRGGSSIQQFAEAACNSAYTPKQIDLVVMDVTTVPCDACGGSTEMLLRRLLKMPTKPLVVLLSNPVLTCLQPGAEEREARRCQECMMKLEKNNECLWKACRPKTCPVNSSRDFSDAAVDAWKTSYLEPYVALVELYDVAHVSMVEPMRVIFEDSEGAKKLDLTKGLSMELAFFESAQHLRRAGFGTFVVADMLVNLLARGQERLANMTEVQRAGLTYSLPRKVLNEIARHTFHTRCYGPSLNQSLEHGSASESVQQAVKATLLDDTFNFMRRAEDVRPGLGLVREEGVGKHQQVFSATEMLPELRVLEASGWRLHVYYKDKGGNVKIKPGYVADQPGSAIVFEVNSEFPELPGRPAEVLVTYTTSYSGWGKVNASCVSGCRCSPAVIDASVTVKESVHKIHSLNDVTQHPACHVRFEVAQETSSNGHKFKISLMSVRVEDHDGEGRAPAAPRRAAARR